MKISFVIPIYKVQKKYLSELINSLNIQKYHNMFECLFVVDEVNPITNYGTIIEGLNRNIKCLIIHNKINLGAGDARNVGIDNSSGDYIAFIDSDDNISLDYVEKIIDLLKVNETDLIRINYTKNYHKENISSIENYKHFKNSIIPGWASYTMIVKRSFLQKHKIRFIHGSNYGEDIYLFLSIMCNTDLWYEINDQLYFYNREIVNSITSKMHKNYVKTFFTIHKIIKLSAKNFQSKSQKMKFIFYKKYIWTRTFKNAFYAFCNIDRTNI